MAIKAVNDTAGPDDIMPTLLVFGAFPRISQQDALATSVIAWAEAVRNAITVVCECHVACQITDALRIRNGPQTSYLIDLPINSDVLVQREGKGQQGPLTLLVIDRETCQIQLPNGPRSLQSTAIKPFHKDPDQVDDNDQLEDLLLIENVLKDTT